MNDNLKKRGKALQKKVVEDMKREILEKGNKKQPEKKSTPKKYGSGGYGR